MEIMQLQIAMSMLMSRVDKCGRGARGFKVVDLGLSLWLPQVLVCRSVAQHPYVKGRETRYNYGIWIAEWKRLS